MTKRRKVGNKTRNLAEAIRRRFARFGGVELEMPKREPIRKLPRIKAG